MGMHFHIYFISKELWRMDASVFGHRTAFSIFADREVDNTVHFGEEVVASQGICSLKKRNATTIPDEY